MPAKRDLFGLRTKNVIEEKEILRPVTTLHNVTMSPMKACMSFVMDNSPKRQLNLLLNSPSPKKLVQRLVTCRNIGILLQTPGKDDNSEDTEERDEEQIEPSADSLPAKRTKPKRRAAAAKSEGVGGNFVRINLRRKVFAPQSRTNFKRKWPKKKRRTGARK